MKYIRYFAVLFVFWLVLASCNRTFRQEAVGDLTPPELQVIVQYDDESTVTGASVELYGSRDDGESRANALAAKVTDEEGKVYFVADDLEKKGAGIFYLYAEKGAAKSEVLETPYLILNDGRTSQFIIIK